MSSNTDPFGAFFNYAARYWKYHLHSAPVDFRLDDILELASPTSARHRAWVTESGWFYAMNSSSSMTATIQFFVIFGKASMLEQLLDRFAPNDDVDRRNILEAAKTAICCREPGQFRTLMNHRSTAMTMQVKMLEILTSNWKRLGSGDLEEWTNLITGLFDTLAVASDTIPSSPNYLLMEACGNECMPAIKKIFERAKTDPAFQEQLMQPTDGMGPLGKAVLRGNVAMLRYLCQQDGIEAHASYRDSKGSNILAYCSYPHKVEKIELLLDKFPWLAAGE